MQTALLPPAFDNIEDECDDDKPLPYQLINRFELVIMSIESQCSMLEKQQYETSAYLVNADNETQACEIVLGFLRQQAKIGEILSVKPAGQWDRNVCDIINDTTSHVTYYDGRAAPNA